jgi:glutamate--cysteine ligase catalytic subunit
MGLLKKGQPLTWFEALPYVPYVREHGIKQFLIIYNKVKDRSNDALKWGDEIEYQIVKKDSKQRQITLSLRGKEILDILNKQEEDYWQAIAKNPNADITPPLASWKPEYGRYMIEGTPFFPYDGNVSTMLTVEENMRRRREMVSQLLQPDESLVTLTMFPLMGAKKILTSPAYEPNGPIAQSLFLPDEIINEHPRFGTLTRNIRLRRGGKVCILVPLFMDKNTDPQIGQMVPWELTMKHKIDLFMSQCSPTQYFSPTKRYLLSNEQKETNSSCPDAKVPQSTTPVIYMDAMGFGMGCCCMQCTFQARDIYEARCLYDHLAVLCPIFLALTAATPIVRGLLAETDVRWNIVSASVDDRTPEEKLTIAKSRYDSVSCYIHDNEEARKYSDLQLELDQKSYETLIENGIDEMLARHISHLFIRDPLVIFAGAEEVDDENESDHFENIQSTNWQTVRFKPPPPNSSIGWRVEFRVMEVQFTDFENAAFIVFIVLLTRVILSYNLNFYMPLSLVDMNMAKAHKRGAVTEEMFHFRRNIYGKEKEEAQVELLTINEILNGSHSKYFVGLIPLIRKYLDDIKLEVQDRIKMERYINLISKRASGELQTNATFLRNLVMNHPSYNHDSVIDDDIAYDIIKKVEKMASNNENLNHYPELFGALFANKN